MSVISQNYAGGLFEAAQGGIGAVLDALDDFDAAVNQSAEFSAFLYSPVVPSAAKKNAISQYITDSAPKTALHFLSLLVDKRRLMYLPAILRECRERQAAQEDILIISVTSATPLSEQQKDELALLYGKKHGKAKTTVINRVSPSIIGGLRVQIGDILTDDSVSTRLRKLAAAIK
ncbi:ATP synthase subunit delta [Clostridia bacterium]|nr:ATP synthase subunit delta [Clostridia bacterium]